MRRNHWHDLGPSLLVAAGILAATPVAVLTAGSAGWVLTGPLLLAFAMLSADVLASRLRGQSGPSAAALILAGALLLASLIVTLRDPRLVQTLIPIVGAASWITLLRHPEGRRRHCKSI